MPMATIHKMGDGDVYHIHFLDQRTDPGYGRPGGGGHPDQGLPGGGHVSNRPPGSWEGRPDNTLPGQGGNRPSNELPGGGGGLPDVKPPQLAPGYLLILARGQDGKWHYAALAPGSAPPKPLPEPPKPDTGPVNPDAPPAPDQTLPPIAPA
jgi:hypothetical protein